MKSTRREFIQSVGITLASLLAASCQPTCYAPVPPSPIPPSSSSSDPLWIALRECWLGLKDTRLQSFEDTDFSRQLRQRHADALDALVSGGELDSAVAGEIGVAFEQAIAHIQRQMATCYTSRGYKSSFFKELKTQGNERV